MWWTREFSDTALFDCLSLCVSTLRVDVMDDGCLVRVCVHLLLKGSIEKLLDRLHSAEPRESAKLLCREA